MTATPYFSGVERDKSHREEARRIAKRLLGAHRELGHHLLFSAAAYLMRDGQPTRDSAVVAEARRRKAHVERACEAHRNRERRSSEESPFAEVVAKARS